MISRFALSGFLVVAALASAGAQGSTGVIEGTVVVSGTTVPVAYSDVAIEGTNRKLFSDDKGYFRIGDVPAGTHQLRVRRIGFYPVTVTATLAQGQTVTVKVELTKVAIRLEAVEVKDACAGGWVPGDSTSSLLPFIDQLRQNSERNALYMRERPFVYTVQRMIQSFPLRGIRSAPFFDTTTYSPRDSARYEPGRAIVWEGSGQQRRRKVLVPELVDFAAPAFIDNHCFAYRGRPRIDGAQTIQIDFGPARAVSAPDFSGSLYLDARTLVLKRVVMRLEIRDSVEDKGIPMVYIAQHEVESDFVEALPFVPVMQTIKSTVRSGTVPPDKQLEPRLASVLVEEQRMVTIRFKK